MKKKELCARGARRLLAVALAAALAVETPLAALAAPAEIQGGGVEKVSDAPDLSGEAAEGASNSGTEEGAKDTVSGNGDGMTNPAPGEGEEATPPAPDNASGTDKPASDNAGGTDRPASNNAGDADAPAPDSGATGEQPSASLTERRSPAAEASEGMIRALDANAEADAAGFVIEDGVLVKYEGTNPNVVIPEGVVEIGDRAFKGTGIKKVKFASTVKKIGGEAFDGCLRLEEVELNKGLEEIGYSAFEGTGLRTIALPDTVTTLWYAIFKGCTKLEKAVLGKGVRGLGGVTFLGCKNLKEVVFGNQIKGIGSNDFNGCSSLKSIVLPTSVQVIAVKAFADCSPETLVLSEGLQKIYGGAFFGVKTKKLTIPGTVTEINNDTLGLDAIGAVGAFEGSKIEEITFANGQAGGLTLGSRTFQDSAVVKVTLPNRVKKIEELTFSGCSKLSYLYIPESVTDIDDGAIRGCPKVAIYGKAGSAAEAYAKKMGFPFNRGAGGSAGGSTGTASVASVKLTPGAIDEAGEDVVGRTVQLRAEISPKTAQNKEVTYQSSNESVATVSAEGLLTIQGEGSAVVTVTTVDGGKKDTCKVSVSKRGLAVRSVSFGKSSSVAYTGSPLRPAATVYDQSTKRRKLTLGTDYTIRYENNVDVGTAKAIVTGIGEYGGTVEGGFTIRPKSIADVSISPVGDVPAGQAPTVVVMDGARQLTEGVDYEVNETSGAAVDGCQTKKISVTGKGNYTGSSKRSVTYKLIDAGSGAKSITDPSIKIAWKAPKSYTYSGAAQKPAVVVRDGGTVVPASLYKLVYSDNVDAGTASLRVMGVTKKGKGYYGVSEPLTFSIAPKDFSKVTAPGTLSIPRAAGADAALAAIQDSIVVKDGKRVLSSSEYTLESGALPESGSCTVTLRAAGGNYTGSKSVTVKFAQKNLASPFSKVSAQVTDPASKLLRIRYNGKELTQGTDFIVKTWKREKNGTYTVTVEGTRNGGYKGKRTFKKL